MSRQVDAVIEYLESEKSRGKTHIYLDDAARDSLRELFIRSRRKPQITQPEEPETYQEQTTEIVITGTNKQQKLDSIRKQTTSYPPLKTLGTLRETMVFATGHPDADIMLIGDAPGHNEEKEQKPFAGPAGKKLDDILKAMGLSRAEVYISNLVKFRPAIAKQTTNNRKPTADEMAASLPLIMAEISVIKPKLIIILGSTVAEGLLGLEEPIGSMREKWHSISGIPARVTYHPSYLLQAGDSNTVKRSLWEDMLATMEKLGMPISEKQKSYFLPKH